MANFVMTYASKSPQKVDQEPSKMTIYDLQVRNDNIGFKCIKVDPSLIPTIIQGDVDVVDFQVGSSSEQQQQHDEEEHADADTNKLIPIGPQKGKSTFNILLL